MLEQRTNCDAFDLGHGERVATFPLALLGLPFGAGLCLCALLLSWESFKWRVHGETQQPLALPVYQRPLVT